MASIPEVEENGYGMEWKENLEGESSLVSVRRLVHVETLDQGVGTRNSPENRDPFESLPWNGFSVEATFLPAKSGFDEARRIIAA